MTDLQVSSELEFDVTRTAEIVLQTAVARRPGVAVQDRFEALLDGRAVPVAELDAPDGGRLHVLTADPGRLRLSYEAEAAVSAAPAAVTPLERVTALQPSRYCPSDRLLGFAAGQFGPGVEADEIAGFVHDRLVYRVGASTVSTDATDTLLTGAGVCRDYAHLVCALSRAAGIPARVAAVYAPGLSPMDFHAVAEVAVDGVWRLVDATRLAPRPAMLRIATGPDAATTAFATVQSGAAELTTMNVFAVVAGDLPLDDHTGPVSLA